MTNKQAILKRAKMLYHNHMIMNNRQDEDTSFDWNDASPKYQEAWLFIATVDISHK